MYKRILLAVLAAAPTVCAQVAPGAEKKSGPPVYKRNFHLDPNAKKPEYAGTLTLPQPSTPGNALGGSSALERIKDEYIKKLENAVERLEKENAELKLRLAQLAPGTPPSPNQP